MKALRLPIRVSVVAYLFRFHGPRLPPAVRARRSAPAAAEVRCRPGVLVRRRPTSPAHRYVDAHGISQVFRRSCCAFAPLRDPGRTDVSSPWRSRRCCPRWIDGEGFGESDFGADTQLRHSLPYASRVALLHTCKARFRLAGWPLPGGICTHRTATRGFSSCRRSFTPPALLTLPSYGPGLTYFVTHLGVS